MPAPPLLVLFDLDGVLADYDRPVRCAALARAAKAGKHAIFEALFGDDGLEHDSDRGDTALQGLLDGLRERHGWSVDTESFLDARRIATRVRPAMIALCEDLATQARLAVFTNNGDWMVEHIGRITPELPRVFGAAIVSSGQLRQCKPNPAAFHACLARLGDAAPANTLFIDDNADNVSGARAAGLDALLFTDIGALRGQLRARGFILQGVAHAP